MVRDESVRKIEAKVRAALNERTETDEPDDVIRGAIVSIVMSMEETAHMGLIGKVGLIDGIFASIRGMDALQPLMDDGEVTEVMVNGHDSVFVGKGGMMQGTDVRFDSRERYEDLIHKVVSGVNRVVNESSPIVDARLPDGSRVSVVMPPVALAGPYMTIRKFPKDPLTMGQLVALGTLTQECAEFMGGVVACGYNVFVSGGTGSGKTTFLNVLAGYIPPHERVITIEDSAELQIRSVPNMVRMETKNANTQGTGEIGMQELIKASLRMAPNRIIVGECRGSEAFSMLQAMNTGHDGSLSTGHANSARDMLGRLETMVLAGCSYPLDAIRRQIASGIEIIVHLAKSSGGRRLVMEIDELVGPGQGSFELNPLFERDEAGELVRTKNGVIKRKRGFGQGGD
ncbi:MAG: CpaF family protein [Oscillospiraceae bacterium]|nr:CpaF family protein [Oscillospiraceae bacterium]